MSFLTKMVDKCLPEKAKTSLVKHKVQKEAKKYVNEKLGLEGQLDKHVEALADKVIDTAGVSNVLKAKDIYDKLSKLKTDKKS